VRNPDGRRGSARECLSLPIYPELADAQIQRVVEVIKGFFRK
jgi:dTDP-4-amino-4,6-dideoxygalactose transaminase